MYALFRFHHKTPSEIYWMPLGERQILYSFMRYELEQRSNENSSPDGGGL
ncbi:hypothetical protein [Anaerosinus massiliensis]|nr:hypothetical protein [Massilibacillus massiliensis]